MHDVLRDWPVRQVEALGLPVGLCAWRATMLMDSAGLAHVKQRPSWVVVEPGDGDDVLAAVAQVAATLPIVVRVDEPDFARRFEAQVRRRIEPLGSPAAVVSLRVQDPAELKGGGLMQTLHDLRQQGLFRHIGLASEEVLSAEWLSRNTPARVIELPYALGDQAARHRVTASLADMGQMGVALEVTGDDDSAALAFALGDAARVLPLRDKPLPEGCLVMGGDAIEAAWQAYQAGHPAPPPLPRSRPPE